MIEIDVLPSSSDKKGADSILLRFGTFSYDTNKNSQKVVLIDGGYKENTKRIQTHLDEFYDTKRIDLLICTHPDGDHINGAVELLNDKSIIIDKVLVHNPWDYSYTVNRKSSDNRTTANSIETRLENSLSSLDDFISKLDERKIEYKSPFAGREEFSGSIKILGPTKPFYTKKITEFPGMPDHGKWSESYSPEIVNYDEDMKHFVDEPETSARNASSAIVLFEYKGFKVLFTGDAGVESLELAIKFAEENNIDLTNLDYMQIPHHGSLKNMSKALADKIETNQYFVSAPSNSEKHPSKLLLNYFQNKLNKKVFHISTNTLCMSKNAPTRNWSSAENTPLFDKVQVLIKK